MDWNFSKSFNQSGDKPKYLLVADDVIGGYFALNGGSLGIISARFTIFRRKT